MSELRRAGACDLAAANAALRDFLPRFNRRGSDSCVRLEGMALQLPPGPGGRSLAGRRVEVELRLDGRLREVQVLAPGGPQPEPTSRNVG